MTRKLEDNNTEKKVKVSCHKDIYATFGKQ